MNLLTVKECAKRLSISLGLAYRLIENGELASIRIASAIRVAEDDLMEYIESRRQGPVRNVKLKRLTL